MSETICYRCKYFFRKDNWPGARDIWWNHLCKVNPLPEEKNFVTGEVKKGFAFCQDINIIGMCPNFKIL